MLLSFVGCTHLLARIALITLQLLLLETFRASLTILSVKNVSPVPMFSADIVHTDLLAWIDCTVLLFSAWVINSTIVVYNVLCVD